MRAVRVEVKNSLIQPFRRRALRRAKQNKEYIEAFFCKKISNRYVIKEFHTLKIVSSGCDFVEFDTDQIAELKALAKQKGLLFSTIHTHVQTNTFDVDTVPSSADHLDAIDTKEHLIGICTINKHKSGRLKTELTFWYPQTCILNIRK
jgi:hypothetical protein